MPSLYRRLQHALGAELPRLLFFLALVLLAFGLASPRFPSTENFGSIAFLFAALIWHLMLSRIRLYGAMAEYPRPLSALGRKNATESVKRVADVALKKGVTHGLEVVNRYETNHPNTAMQALEMLDRIDAPNVYVHLGESGRGCLGSGTVDFGQLFKALAMIDYQGVITFESFSSTVVNEELSNALAIWRNLWDDGMNLAVHAREFMAGSVRATAMAKVHGGAWGVRAPRLPLSCGLPTKEAEAPMREWIDTHLHMIEPDRLRYDWITDWPTLRGRFSIDTYRAQALALGITQALHMEVDVREADIEVETAWVDALAATPTPALRIAGLISACRPEAAGFAEFVARQAVTPRVRGFRRVLHTMPAELSTTPLFRDNVKRLEGTGYTFDLCVLPSRAAETLALVRHCPGVSFVVDHCGVPDVAGAALDPWRAQMRELAAEPNVSCKLSGVIAYGDATRWPEGDVAAITRDLRPFVEHCIDCFGWQRVVWGSDWPVCTLTRGLGPWMAVTQALLQGCSADQIDALAHRNARRIYRLDELVSGRGPALTGGMFI